MAERTTTALLMLDFQVGVGDQPFAKEAAIEARKALQAGRKANMPIIFSKLCFRPGYPEVASSNPTFSMIREKQLFGAEDNRVVADLSPLPQELVVNKRRFSAFSGSDLEMLLRAGEVGHVVLAGLSTSGVILSTFCETSDRDYAMTILSNACADPKPVLHRELMIDLFPRSAHVTTVDEWTTSLIVEETSLRL